MRIEVTLERDTKEQLYIAIRALADYKERKRANDGTSFGWLFRYGAGPGETADLMAHVEPAKAGGLSVRVWEERRANADTPPG